MTSSIISHESPNRLPPGRLPLCSLLDVSLCPCLALLPPLEAACLLEERRCSLLWCGRTRGAAGRWAMDDGGLRWIERLDVVMGAWAALEYLGGCRRTAGSGVWPSAGDEADGRWRRWSDGMMGRARGCGQRWGSARRRVAVADGGGSAVEDDGDAVGGKAGQLAVPLCKLLMGWRDGSSGGGMVAAGLRMWVADRI
ncbi:hypothetical protein ACLOJK_041015 [Asimina triloba]